MRTSLRAYRKGLDTSQQSKAALALIDSVAELARWDDAQDIAIYLPFDVEIDTTPLIDFARRAGKCIHLPIITEQDSLDFALWSAGDELLKNRFNIPEPSTTAPRSPPETLDIIFLPLVAWDKRGSRLGMGAGFYDRALAGVTGPLRVGLAHTCQQVEYIAREEWDVALNFVATDTGLHNCAAV